MNIEYILARIADELECPMLVGVVETERDIDWVGLREAGRSCDCLVEMGLAKDLVWCVRGVK